MPVKVEKIGANQVEMEITVPAEIFRNQLKKTAKKVAGKVSIPGFRKGKAPLNVLESRLGREYMWGEAADEIMGAEYSSAVAESGILPVSQPEADIVQLEAGKEFIYKVKVFVKPEIELGEYKDLGVEKTETLITDEQVEEELKRRQRMHSKLINVEQGNVEDGDAATIDYSGSVDGELFEGGTAEGRDLKIGSGSFIPGFEEQVTGMAIGEVKDITVSFPEKYHSEHLAGKEAVFRVKVRGIKRTELLPLDDEFVKDVSEFDTLEEYKEDLRRTLQENAEEGSLQTWRGQILQKALDNAALPDIPPSMIEFKIDEMLSELAAKMREQGFSLEQYCAHTGTTDEALREQYREPAARTVKMDLFLEAVAAREEIKLSKRDLDASLAETARRYNLETEEVQNALLQQGELERYLNGLLAEKTIRFVLRANNFPVPEELPDEEEAGEQANETGAVPADETGAAPEEPGTGASEGEDSGATEEG
ncbi:MAG: trigger factor [Gracilibacteraceae bacterium]|nr:trigger factor [Gracilibacteraceae bacterium]